MPAAARLSDNGKVSGDAHGCPACPHTCVGPAILGSPTVFVNSLPFVRETDIGVHAVCCGPNMWTATKGSPDVFVNSLAAHRKDDDHADCGGQGKMIAGSPTVFVNG